MRRRSGETVDEQGSSVATAAALGISPWRHVLGMGWVLLASCAVLTPAFVHGALGGGSSLYDPITFDQVDEIIPWSALAWSQVHSGHLPLWNPYSVLGTPLAFNWQSAPFSLPSLIGYLFPLHLAFTVQLLVTLFIAGSGLYFLGRVMGLGVLGCTFGATVFELSGAFVGWLGWPVSSVMSWAGWVFGAALLILRGRHRAKAITLLAVGIAFAIYSGQPDTLAVFGAALLVFVVAILVGIGRRDPRRRRRVRRPLADLAIGSVAGLAFGAPVLLPGVQLVRGANRNRYAMTALPVHDLVHVIFQGFDGVPVKGGLWFGGALSYEYSSAYVGVIALVLGACALWWRRHDIEVIGFAAVAVVMGGIAFTPPAVSVLDGIGTGVLWNRGVFLMTFAIAVLAGVGMDALVRHYATRGSLMRVAVGFGVAAIVLVALWLFGRGHLGPRQTHMRANSFLWPSIEIAVGLVVVVVALVVLRRDSRTARARNPQVGMGRWIGASLLACETAFLVTAGVPLWSSSALLTPTSYEAALQRTVGASLVGFGARSCFPTASLGILADINVEFGVHEMSVYDPTIPREYFSTWRALTGDAGGNGIHQSSFFCPVVPSARVARRFGVEYLLLPAGVSGPAGTVFSATIGDQRLYRVPGAAIATETPISRHGGLPGPDAPGRPLSVRRPGPASLTLVTDGVTRQVLRVRLTDVPGWHASIDGRSLALRSFSGVMLQARIPPGRHVIRLEYWPSAFTFGVIVAIAGIAGLFAFLFGAPFVRRLKSARSHARGREPVPSPP